ncbi:hypothetical protein BYT27DRAFT_7197407 [Phlegmacium glaucopus]|nr:hypothetical protein BYT27DRAFT_7197407 [Phlegmacium glaucopus]
MTLVGVALDLHIVICTFLHPSDILSLRKTCKTLQLVTRQRLIWIDALHRVCLENTLFLPSFPIPNMSDAELEQAAIAPRRWIELSASFATQGISGSESGLSPTVTRFIDDPFGVDHATGNRAFTELILVPGGRYMVGYSRNGVGVWDLGYMSSADCKLIASLRLEHGSGYGDVHATSDGMGLIIFLLRPYYECNCSCYEIYPQSKTPQLIQIACLDFHHFPGPYCGQSYILSDNIILYNYFSHGIALKVWDYRLNASASFTAEVDAKKFDYNTEVLATKTALVILHEGGILIWAIPPLSQPADFDRDNIPRLQPLIRLKFPDGLARHPEPPIWRRMSRWYSGSSQPLYFDMVHERHLELQRFKIIIKPDLSDATLHFIDTLQLTPRDSERLATPSTSNICEDTMVSFWDTSDDCGIYTGSILSHPTNTVSHRDPYAVSILLPVDGRGHSHSLCPASGRFVHLDYDDHDDISTIVVVDFLPHSTLDPQRSL